MNQTAQETARRIRENRDFVRALLARKDPEFARALAAAAAELELELELACQARLGLLT